PAPEPTVALRFSLVPRRYRLFGLQRHARTPARRSTLDRLSHSVLLDWSKRPRRLGLSYLFVVLGPSRPCLLVPLGAGAGRPVSLRQRLSELRRFSLFPGRNPPCASAC